jgi:hypothetical protein
MLTRGHEITRKLTLVTLTSRKALESSQLSIYLEIPLITAVEHEFSHCYLMTKFMLLCLFPGTVLYLH